MNKKMQLFLILGIGLLILIVVLITMGIFLGKTEDANIFDKYVGKVTTFSGIAKNSDEGAILEIRGVIGADIIIEELDFWGDRYNGRNVAVTGELNKENGKLIFKQASWKLNIPLSEQNPADEKNIKIFSETIDKLVDSAPVGAQTLEKILGVKLVPDNNPVNPYLNFWKAEISSGEESSVFSEVKFRISKTDSNAYLILLSITEDLFIREADVLKIYPTANFEASQPENPYTRQVVDEKWGTLGFAFEKDSGRLVSVAIDTIQKNIKQ